MVFKSFLVASRAPYCRLQWVKLTGCDSVPIRCLQTQVPQDVADPVQKIKSYSQIPGPKTVPLIGNLFSLVFNSGQ